MSFNYNNNNQSNILNLFRPTTTPLIQTRQMQERFLSSSKVFLDSNNIVMRFAFLIVILVSFLLLLRLGTMTLGYLMSPSKTPHLIDGMTDGKHMSVIHMDPTLKGSKPILRSVNKDQGIEFTWSIWIFVEDLEYKKGVFKHIFHKGNDSINSFGLNTPNNAPGLYLDAKENNLVVLMNTFNEIEEFIEIEDIPLNKWLNVIIRCEGRNLDVYINGKIVKRHVLSGVPKQNYGDVYMSMNGGFSGVTSNLWYYDYALGLREINTISNNGPSLQMRDTQMKDPQRKYLSDRWYLDQIDG